MPCGGATMAGDGNDDGFLTRILGDVANGQAQAIKHLRDLLKQSAGNSQCVASSNADVAVASAFSANCGVRPAINIHLCQDAIGALALILPLGAQSRGLLASFDALRGIAWILRNGSPDSRSSAVLVLQDLMAGHRERIGSVDGLAEGLVEVVKEGICPAATKACLTILYHIAGGRRIREVVVEAGAIPVVLELLPDAERGTCERGMACLHALCNSKEGRSAAERHALTIPLLVKKLLRVSQLTTEFAVSVLWTICGNSSEESLLIEAVEVGAFDKLVMLLQVGCTPKTKERAAQLLKLLNDYNNYRVHCDRAKDSNHAAKR